MVRDPWFVVHRPIILTILPDEELAGRANGALDLPQRAAAIVSKRIQRADFGECRDFVAAQAAFLDQIFD